MIDLFSVFRAKHFLSVDICGSRELGEQAVDVQDGRRQTLDVGRDLVDRPLLADPEQHLEAVVDAVRKSAFRKRSDCLRSCRRVDLLELNGY